MAYYLYYLNLKIITNIPFNLFLKMLKKIISFRFSTNLNIKLTDIHLNASTSQTNRVNHAMQKLPPIPSVSIIRTKEQAKHVVNILKKLKTRFHAWDTETIDVDPKIQSPVNHGQIICMSCFAGPDVDFGNGPSNIKYLYRTFY